VTVEVAVVGAPFLDITFEGLPRVPEPREELVGRRLHLTPGGTGIQAVGLARLGVSVALVAPMGDDPAGIVLRQLLEREGVRLVGPHSNHTPVTALLSTPAGTAMASVVPTDEPRIADVASVGAESFVLSIGRLHLAPQGTRVYAVTGPGEIERVADALREAERRPHALICNGHEAAVLTGLDDPEAAARELAQAAGTAIVTLGPEGALGVEGDRIFRSRAPEVDPVDVTGAGDLFMSAYVWAELRGDDLERRVGLATLYAGLSVGAQTALDGALNLSGFLAELDRRNLG
jgi:sugar/nucleoside kinase (ribokinase family)